MCEEFCHLHSHSRVSVDGINSPTVLADRAKALGMRGMALTDHGDLGGLVEFSHSTTKDFKAIGGLEAYLVVNGVRTHITLLANGYKGYVNLAKMINHGVDYSISTGKDLAYHPIHPYALEKYSEDVVVLTGCPSSIMQVKHNDLMEATNFLNYLKGIYQDRLFVEVMFNSDSETVGNTVGRSFELSAATGIPLVLTNDIHFSEKHQVIAHKFYNSMLHGLYYPADELYLKSYHEMLTELNKLFASNSEKQLLLGAIHRSVDIVNRLDPLKFSGKASLPHIADGEASLRKMTFNSLELRAQNEGWPSEKYQKYLERTEYELDIITSRGYSTYFVIVNDVVDSAKSQGHMVGPGRGSAVGSLVCYLLGITSVDPVEYNLIFERFLNPEREAMPDIDLDFSNTARDVAVNYCAEKFGAIGVRTNSIYTHKALVNDLGKYLRLPQNIIDDVGEYGEASQYWDKLDPKFHEIYTTMIDQAIRHHGKHAGGVLLKGDEVIPMTIGKDGKPLAAYPEGSKSDLGEVGGVKLDLLAISILTVLQSCIEQTGEIPPVLAPDEYHPCFELIKKDQLDCIFQLGGQAARNMVKKLEADSVSDIAVASALSRTGAKDSGAQDAYPKHRARKGHPRVRGIPPHDSGNLYDLTIDGETFTYYGHWHVKLMDGTWKQVQDILFDDKIFLES